ncbi:MAG: hypothetical protein JSR77_09590 [Planctomycetes bacterium]|nr:hypothetical protein [Planctomycetota bacterium]
MAEVASESTVAAEKLLEFLRTFRGLLAEEWNKLTQQAQKMHKGKVGRVLLSSNSGR